MVVIFISSSSGLELPVDRLLELLRLETERAFAALVEDRAVGGEQVEPVRPAAVGGGDRVVHPVHDHWHAELQLDGAGLSDAGSFVVRSRLVDGELRAPVLRDHPAVLRMSLSDVDREERDFVAVAVRQLLERTDLGAKRRSGV
jgi:hypothetical protein